MIFLLFPVAGRILQKIYFSGFTRTSTSHLAALSHLLGGKRAATLDRSVEYLVAAHCSLPKCARARLWYIPVVSDSWLIHTAASSTWIDPQTRQPPPFVEPLHTVTAAELRSGKLTLYVPPQLTSATQPTIEPASGQNSGLLRQLILVVTSKVQKAYPDLIATVQDAGELLEPRFSY